MMRNNLTAAAIGILAGFAGAHLAYLTTVTVGAANLAPRLTGDGKVLFSENAAPATISASSGALTIAAGGSNQNVILAPSGSGVTSTAAPILSDLGAAPAESQFVAKANALGALALISRAANNQQIFFDAERTGGNTVARDTTAAAIRKASGVLAFNWAGGLTVGNTFAFSTGPLIDLATGNMCFGGNTSCGYAVDATGETNTSVAYRVAGTQVVGTRKAAVTAPTGGGTIDSQARTAINDIISRLQSHGLIN